MQWLLQGKAQVWASNQPTTCLLFALTFARRFLLSQTNFFAFLVKVIMLLLVWEFLVALTFVDFSLGFEVNAFLSAVIQLLPFLPISLTFLPATLLYDSVNNM